MNIKQTLLTATASAILSLPAQAIININIYESGDDVLAIASGSANLAGFTNHGDSSFSPQLTPSGYLCFVGASARTPADTYSSISYPPNTYGGAKNKPTYSSGDAVGVALTVLALPDGYES